MNHNTSPDFWAAYRELPVTIQKAADSAFALLNSNPRHPSLHLKKVRNFWSARVGLGYRAVAVESNDGLVWFWIGTHAEYDKLLG
ncbi:MAG: hypothetical protein ACMG6H_06615 [Acidobacteriota bacterium]